MLAYDRVLSPLILEDSRQIHVETLLVPLSKALLKSLKTLIRHSTVVRHYSLGEAAAL